MGKPDLAGFRRTQNELHRAEEALSLEILKSQWSRGAWNSHTAGHLLEYIGRNVLPEAGEIERYRQDARAMADQHGIRVQWIPESESAHMNGYARRRLNEIECCAIKTVEDYLRFLHEAFHCLRPCKSYHDIRRKGTDEICVRCELDSWLAVASHALEWNARAHVFMTRCLNSYRPYATVREQAAIDTLTSDTSRRVFQHRALARELRAEGIR